MKLNCKEFSKVSHPWSFQNFRILGEQTTLVISIRIEFVTMQDKQDIVDILHKRGCKKQSASLLTLFSSLTIK